MSNTLCVQQGSCLEPLFVLIFINDLPHFLDVSTKLFADDMTLYLTGNDLNQLLKNFKSEPLTLYPGVKLTVWTSI